MVNQQPISAPKSVGIFKRLRLKYSARRDARSYLDIKPGSHTYTTISIEKVCHLAQERAWVWLTVSNETLFASLEDIQNRIDFVNARIANLKGTKTETDRMAASNFAKISQSHGELLEKLARRAQIMEKITANNDVAEAAVDSWRVFFGEQAAIYLEALNKKSRRILRTPKTEPIRDVEIPIFSGAELRVRDGFEKKLVTRSTRKA